MLTRKGRRTVALRPDEYVNLKGKQHALYKGVLREAIENGLTRLVVTVLQFPSPENGNLAVCSATAVFEGADGKERMFVEVGDCDDRNCGSMIAMHKIRMSATRAKGRALRDALGLGEALFEEMGGADPEPAQKREYQEPNARPSDAETQGAPVSAGDGTQDRCYDCGADLTRGQVKLGIATYGLALCPTHQRDHPRLDAK